jgi:hypothetical protein
MLRTTIIVFCLLCLASCKEKDEFSPEVIGLSPTVIDGTEQVVMAGSEIIVSVQASDDAELQDLRLEILENIDNQDTLAPFGKNIGSWDELEFATVSGVEDQASFSFLVPETVNGEWTIAADVIDGSGKQSETATFELWVFNELTPAINVTSLEPDLRDGILFIGAGGTVVFSGSVSSETPLSSVGYFLLDPFGSQVWFGLNSAGGQNTIDLEDFPFQAPQGFSGSFTLRIEATDIEQRVNCQDVVCVIGN